MAGEDDPRERRSTVPEAVPSDESGSDSFLMDDMFGAEASIPLGFNSVQPIGSRFPDATTVTPEVEDYEKRIRAHMSPVFSMVPRRRPPLEWMWKRYRRFAMRNRSGQVDDFGRDPVYAARIESVLDFLTRRYFHVEVAGLENVPKEGAAILVCNRSGPSPWDAILLSHALQKLLAEQRTVRPLVDDTLFYFPYLGVFLNRIGAVRACTDNGLRLLERQTLVALFPESPAKALRNNSADTDPAPFGPGGFLRLAVKTGAPLVPVGITCTETGAAPGKINFPDFVPAPLRASGVLPRRSRWRFTFGSPIRLPDGLPDSPASLREKAEELREIVMSLVLTKNDDNDFVTLDGRNAVARTSESG